MNIKDEITDKNLRGKTLTGFKWSSINQIGLSAGQFVVGIVLARLLSPKEFGMIGMIIIFIVIGKTLTNSGFGQALIQRREATQKDFSTVFYFNILASIVIYLAVFAATPLIANFYNEPKLIPIIKVLGLIFIIDAIGQNQSTYLEKRLIFKAPSLIGIVSVSIAGIVSITMAYQGFGVWALVANVLVKGIITTILYWVISTWRPTFEFSIISLKGLYSYGSKLLLAGLLHSFFSNIYHIIIGRLFPTQTLGYYTRATSFKDMPIMTISAIVKKVTYPAFSAIQDNNSRLISGYTKLIRVLAAIVLPIVTIMFVTCRPLIEIVIGEKWLPVVPYLRIMCLYGWIYIIFTINNQIITIKGRSDYYLHIQIIDKVLILTSIFFTYKYGITAMIYGHMVSTIITYFIGSFYLRKLLEITITHQLRNILPFFISAAVALFAGIFASNSIANNYNNIIFSTITCGFIYLLLLRICRVKELDVAIKFLLNLGATLLTSKKSKENIVSGL